MGSFAHEGWPRDEAGWAAAAEASGNVFLTPEWARTWWEHLGDGRRVLTAGERDADGRLAAVLVGCLADRGPVRTLRLVGHGPADELGPAGTFAPPGGAGAWLGARLRELDAFDVFLGEQLPGDVDWAATAGARVIDRIASPTIELGFDGWEAYFATRRSGFRTQLRKVERALAEAGAVLRLAEDPERLETDVDALFALHRLRHGERAPFASGRLAAFHRAFARVALERGWLRLAVLELGGAPVAVSYGFRFGGSDCQYQTGRDPAHRLALGSALLAHLIRRSLADGLREYRFLRGGEDYKYRWATHDRGLATVAVGRTPQGRALAGLASQGLRRPRAAVVQRSAGRVARRALLA